MDAKTNADWYRRQVGPFLDEDEAQLLLGLDAAEIRSLIAGKEVLALLWNGRIVFPQWQFDQSGRPFGIIGRVIREFGEAASMFQIAAWFKTPQPFLEDIPPIRWKEADLDDEQVIMAARKRAELLLAHPPMPVRA